MRGEGKKGAAFSLGFDKGKGGKILFVSEGSARKEGRKKLSSCRRLIRGEGGEVIAEELVRFFSSWQGGAAQGGYDQFPAKGGWMEKKGGEARG